MIVRGSLACIICIVYTSTVLSLFSKLSKLFIRELHETHEHLDVLKSDYFRNGETFYRNTRDNFVKFASEREKTSFENRGTS